MQSPYPSKKERNLKRGMLITVTNVFIDARIEKKPENQLHVQIFITKILKTVCSIA